MNKIINKSVLMALIICLLCVVMTGCEKSDVNSVVEDKPSATSTSDTAKPNDETKKADEAKKDIEYTTKDTKFTAPEGLTKEEGSSNTTSFMTESFDTIQVNDSGFWTTNPHPGDVTPKTKEEFKSVDFFMNPNYTDVKDFEYGQTEKAEYMYAEVKGNDITKYVKYFVDKADPSLIIYMEATVVSGNTDVADIVKSFAWK